MTTIKVNLPQLHASHITKTTTEAPVNDNKQIKDEENVGCKVVKINWPVQMEYHAVLWGNINLFDE